MKELLRWKVHRDRRLLLFVCLFRKNSLNQNLKIIKQNQLKLIMNRLAIICVDDEQTILDSLKTELKQTFSNQYLIETAESGEEALELIEELLEDHYEVPLVISDYMMPNLKGDEFLKRIHTLSPKTRKVMLTGQADIEAVGNAINYAKLYRYIHKPWNTEDLTLTISEAVKSYFNEKQLIDKNKELERKVTTFHKFVPVQFLKRLGLKEYEQIELGNCVKETMTIMFADIRDFTSLSEKMTPQENFYFINAYLSQMEPIINKYHGFIDKYIGDAIMALFPIGADDAVQAAISMLKQLVRYNQELQSAGYPPIKIGIGIHTGALMLGTVGGHNRMDTTVVSDAVNLASRVEGLTKTYGVPLLITEQTKSKLTDASQYQIRRIDCVTVKGKTIAVTVYEVFDADSHTSFEQKSKTLLDFEQGVRCFHNEQFNKALTFFEKVVNENDKAAQIYLTHCQNILNMIMPQLPRILIVDDIAINIHLLSNVLIENHFEVLVAENGESALKMVKSGNRPHLILLDVVMPGMDGFETCRQFKADSQTQDIPVIFMTALTDVSDKVEGFKAGGVDYITKPFQDEEVLLRVQTHLKLIHLQQICKFKNSIKISNLELKAKIERLIVHGTV